MTEPVGLQWPGRRAESPQPASLRRTDLIGAERSAGDNRLILAENAAAMAALLTEYRGKLDLIYTDPPFLTGKAYRARSGRGEDSRKPDQWKTTPSFKDQWDDLGEYLNMLDARLRLMHQLLSDRGTLYLHLDWHAAAYGKLLLDEIFGPERLLNEIIWVYHGPSPIKSAFKRKHDTLYAYTKSAEYTFNADAVRIPYDPSTVKTFESSSKAGFGKRPDLERGKVPEDWWYFPVVARLHNERTGYPTQKPEGLLERIILASSDRGDLVGDFFCGSGTTAAVADRLGRHWLACDSTSLAVNTTRRRLLLAPERQPFSVWAADEVADEHLLTPKLELAAAATRAEVRLIGLTGAQVSFPDSLTALELDWDFDGELFRSRSQSVRGWRQEGIQTALHHDYRHGGTYTVAARALAASGAVGYATGELQIG